MPAWYDILGLAKDTRQDEAGISRAATQVAALIDHEISRGVASDRIILGGFSQGGALALHTALRYPKPLAGLLVLSAYLPMAYTLAAERHPANHNINIFLAHGNADPILPLDWAEMADETSHPRAFAPSTP